MDRTEILEQLPEEVKEHMENALFDMEQFGDGYNCAKDAADALELLGKKKFFTTGGKVVRLDGPLNHYNYKLGKYSRDKHHYVGQINDRWVVDIACEPGSRVFYSMNDYKERSGIKLTKA